MNHDQSADLLLADEQRCCAFSRRCPAGPARLDVAGRPLCGAVHTRVGAAADREGRFSGGRVYHRGGGDVVVSEGDLGGGLSVHHTTRLAACFLRLTTDLRARRGCTVEGGIEIGSIDLPMDLVSWRRLVLGTAGFSAPEPLPEAAVDLDADTLALVFQRQDGAALEVGLGADLWRWWGGLLDRAGSWRQRLVPTPDGWRLVREVDRAAEETPLRPRDYRFSWYAAWETAEERERALPATRIPAVWTAADDLDLEALLPHLAGAATAVEIDVAELPGPDSLRRSPDGVAPSPLPCFAAGPTIKRLKRVVRQVAEAAPAGCGIVFRGLRPGFCRTGRHLGRRENAAHWDIAALLEFGLWTRRALGPEALLAVATDAGDGPALRQLFTPAHQQFGD